LEPHLVELLELSLCRLLQTLQVDQPSLDLLQHPLLGVLEQQHLLLLQ
jgi:hypothetical protein